MKRGKRLNRKQKQRLSSIGYDPGKYMLLYDLETTFVLLNKETGITEVVYKNEKGGQA